MKWRSKESIASDAVYTGVEAQREGTSIAKEFRIICIQDRMCVCVALYLMVMQGNHAAISAGWRCCC